MIIISGSVLFNQNNITILFTDSHRSLVWRKRKLQLYQWQSFSDRLQLLVQPLLGKFENQKQDFLGDLQPPEHFTAMIWKASKILGIGLARTADLKRVRPYNVQVVYGLILSSSDGSCCLLLATW